MASNWTRSETISPPNQLTIEYKNITTVGGVQTVEQKSVQLTSTTRSTSQSIYELIRYLDRDSKEQSSEVVIRKIDTTWSTIASVSPGYVAWRLTNDLGLPAGSAKAENITTNEYTITVDGPVMVRETVEQYISMAQFAGGLQIEQWGNFQPSGSEMVLSHRTIREISQIKTADGRDLTQTQTSRWIAAAESSEWKNYAAKRSREIRTQISSSPNAVEPFVRGLIPLVFEGTETQIETGKMPVSNKPSDQELAANRIANGSGGYPSDATPTDVYGNNLGWTSYVPGDWQSYNQDSDNDGIPDWAPYVPGDWRNFDTSDIDYTATDVSVTKDSVINGVVLFNGQLLNPPSFTVTASYELPFAPNDYLEYVTGAIVLNITGQASAADAKTVTATYDMPFAPDDYFQYVNNVPRLIRGGAAAAAEAFGRMETALDIGHAYGQNIVTGWNEAPTLDLSTVYVRLAGIEGAFLLDSCSYAWDADGMVVSSDLMLLGVSGWYGASQPATSWLRLPVPVAGLQQVTAGTSGTATRANSIAIPVGFSARNPAPVLAALPSTGADTYALFRTTQAVVGPIVSVEQVSLATGGIIAAQETTYVLVLSPETATIATGPFIVDSTIVAVPAAATITLAAAVPTISGGVSIAVPAAEISITALAPTITAS